MTDPQLACLAVVAGPMLIGSLWALGDLAGHIATVSPAPQSGDTLRALAGHAVRIAFLAPAALTAALTLAFAFSRRVRP